MRRYFSNGSKTIGPKDINKNGQIESWEEARAKGMAKGMGKEYVDRAEAKKGGSMYHTTKDGRKARKGLYYYMNRAKKLGKSRRGKGTVSDKAPKGICKNSKKIMIRNFKDIVILLITTGVLILLATIIIGDYIVALEENRPVDESIITLMKMSVTGLIGIIGGYIGGSK
jgi:hypothetical protein